MHHHSKLSRPLGAGFEQSTPPGTTMLACTTEAELQAADLPGTPYLRYAASMLLDLFRWLKRFADDISVGPNRYVERLLYTTQTVLGGRSHGLYPTCLTLGKQDSTMHECVALDIRALTDETPYPDAPMTEPGFAYSYTVFFDRRRLQAFSSFDVLRFQHVTSCKTASHAYNMLHGRLCHMLRIIMHEKCFVLQVARCIHHMRRSGYDANCCFTHVARFLRKHLRGTFRTPCMRMFDDISYVYNCIAGFDEGIRGRADEWDPTYHTVVVPLPPAASPAVGVP